MVSPEQGDYAYGWVVAVRGDLRLLTHDGGIDGFSSRIVRVPSLDLVIVVLSNTEGLPTQAISDAALRCARGERLTPRVVEPPMELDAAQRARLVGEYTLLDSARRELSQTQSPELMDSIAGIAMLEQDGALALKPSGQPSLRVVAVSPKAVVVKAIDLRLDFDLPQDPSAPAYGLVLRQSGMDVPYERRSDGVD
jgi:hypothetical protein